MPVRHVGIELSLLGGNGEWVIDVCNIGFMFFVAYDSV